VIRFLRSAKHVTGELVGLNEVSDKYRLKFDTRVLLTGLDRSDAKKRALSGA
jgi:hypothetical protein